MSSPQLSIVIPVHNGVATLEPLLEALDPLALAEAVEILFVDDASTDRTVEMLLAHGHEPLRQKARGGPAAARNAGAKLARAPWLLFLDADTRPPPDTVERVAAALLDPGVVAVVGVYAPEALNAGFWPRYKAVQAESYHRGNPVREITWIWASMTAVRREVFALAGGFDEDYRGADLEDVELGRRLACEGRILLDRDWVVGHHFPASLRENVRNHFKRGRLWVELYRSSRTFDNYLTTRTMALSRLGAAMLPLALALWVGLQSWVAALATLVCLLLYLRGGHSLLRLSRQRGGWGFVAGVGAAEILLSWVLLAAGVVALVAPLENCREAG